MKRHETASIRNSVNLCERGSRAMVGYAAGPPAASFQRIWNTWTFGLPSDTSVLPLHFGAAAVRPLKNG